MIKRAGLLLSWALIACRSPEGQVDAATSPQASAEPAPIVTPPPVASGALSARDGGSGATPLRSDAPVAADPLAAVSGRGEVAGYTLRAVLRPLELPPLAKAAEINGAALESARRSTEPRLTIDLAPGRLRAVLEGALPLASGSELRARSDRLGHVLLDERGESYRVAAPGALRAVLGERRLDVAPLSRAELSPSSDAGRIHGYRARRAEVATRAGRAVFDLARLPEVGEGGELLCRLVLDLLNAPPFTPLCGPDEAPLRVEYRWSGRGGLVFEVQAVARRADLAAVALTVPPLGAAFTDAPMAAHGGEVFVPKVDLALFRNGPVEVPGPPAALQAEVGDGLLLWNATDQLRSVWVDGVPLLSVGPGERRRVVGLPRGRYVLEWRTFLGETQPAGEAVTVPGYAFLGGTETAPN